MGKEQTPLERLGAVLTLRGEWYDEFYVRGEEGQDVLKERTEITHNAILVGAGKLIAGLLANESTFTGGLLYLALGKGDPLWDTAPVNPSFSDVALYDELGRQAPDAIAYTDAVGDPAPPSTITNFIKVTTTFDYVHAINGNYIREMGLFGGDATGLADSGLMLDAIRHAKVYKDSTFKWIRVIRLGL